MVSVVLKLEPENEEVMNRIQTKTTKEKKTKKRNEVRLEKISLSVVLYLYYRLKKTKACSCV